MKALVLASLLLLLCACGTRDVVPADSPGFGKASIAWGPQVGTSHLSAVYGAEDDFGPGLGEVLARAALALPSGASQSSLTTDKRTAREMSVEVVRDEDGDLVYEVSDGIFVNARAPGPPRKGFDLALFAGVPAGIEPDPSSYPHELLGLWAREDEAGVFWSASPSIPPVAFGNQLPVGSATFIGDMVGLLAAHGTTTKFLADVEIVADFDTRTLNGAVRQIRSLADKTLSDLSVTLSETGYSGSGTPFSGETTARTGSGRWGARWSDGVGRAMGGTFGFAADDGSVVLLGAFSACACPPLGGGSPDVPVMQSR